MSFKNNLNKLMVCGASLLMVLSTGAGISNVSAKRVNHARHYVSYRVNNHKSRKAHQAKKAKGTKRNRKAKRAKNNKRNKKNKRVKVTNKHKKVNKKSKKATRDKKSRRVHKSASDPDVSMHLVQGDDLGKSVVNTKENEFDGVTGFTDPIPEEELRWGLKNRAFRIGLTSGFKYEINQSKKEHVIQIANNRTDKQLKTLLNIGKIKNKKTYNRTYNKVMKQMKAEQAALNKKSIRDAEELDQNTTD